VHLLVLAIEHLVLNISINSLNIEHRSERGEGFRSLQIILLLSSSPVQREELWEGRHSSEISGTVAKVITIVIHEIATTKKCRRRLVVYK
jgi:hypothetical protein